MFLRALNTHVQANERARSPQRSCTCKSESVLHPTRPLVHNKSSPAQCPSSNAGSGIVLLLFFAWPKMKLFFSQKIKLNLKWIIILNLIQDRFELKKHYFVCFVLLSKKFIVFIIHCIFTKFLTEFLMIFSMRLKLKFFFNVWFKSKVIANESGLELDCYVFCNLFFCTWVK